MVSYKPRSYRGVDHYLVILVVKHPRAVSAREPLGTAESRTVYERHEYAYDNVLPVYVEAGCNHHFHRTVIGDAGGPRPQVICLGVLQP